MSKEIEITGEIASSTPNVQEYIAQLKKENERLNKALVKNEVTITSLSNRIKALETELKENRPEFKVNINLGNNSGSA